MTGRWMVLLHLLIGLCVLGNFVSAQTDAVLRGPSGEMVLGMGTLESVDYSPDGKSAITAGGVGVFQWDLETGELMRSYIKGNHPVNLAMFTPDGSRIVAVGWRQSVVWDAGTGEEILTFESNMNSSGAASISPDGKLLLLGSWDSDTSAFPVEIRNLETGELVERFGDHTGTLTRAVYSPDMKHILTGAKDGTARIWDAETYEPLHELYHGINVDFVQYSPDGQIAMTKTGYGEVHLWDANSGEEIVKIGDRNEYYLGNNSFSPDGERIISFGFSRDENDPNQMDFETGSIRVWNVRTGELLSTFGIAIRNWSVGMALSPDGSNAFLGTYDGSAQLWNLESQEFVRSFGNHLPEIYTAAFSPDGSRIFVGSRYESKMIDARSGGLLQSFPEDKETFFVDFSQDGKRILTDPLFTDNGPIRIWNAETAEIIGSLDGKGFNKGWPSLSPDGTKIALGGLRNSDEFGSVWDVDTGERMALVATPDSSPNTNVIPHKVSSDISSVAKFSHDGSWILTDGGLDSLTLRNAYIWDAATGERPFELRGHSSRIVCADISKDDRYFVTGSADRSAILWDRTTGEAVQRFANHADAVLYAAISPDNKYVLTAVERPAADVGSQPQVFLWDAETGEQLLFLTAGSLSFSAIEFSPDGKTFLTAGYDGTIRIWSLSELLGGTNVEKYWLY